MGRQSYILFVSCEEDKQRILEAIKAHNTFYDDKPDDGMNDPNFKEEVGEELEGLVYTKLLKNRPKMYANYTHAILCGNGGGRSSTFDWFFKHKISCRPYHCSDSRWLSKKSVKIEYAVENVNSLTEEQTIPNMSMTTIITKDQIKEVSLLGYYDATRNIDVKKTKAALKITSKIKKSIYNV